MFLFRSLDHRQHVEVQWLICIIVACVSGRVRNTKLFEREEKQENYTLQRLLKDKNIGNTPAKLIKVPAAM